MVEVFKTNVNKVSQADKLINLLRQQFPGNKINFDMHDCDKVLRIEGHTFAATRIITIVNENGFACSILE